MSLTWAEFLETCKEQAWKTDLVFDQSDYAPPIFGNEPPSADGIAPEDYSWFIHFRLRPWYEYANAAGGPCSTEGTSSVTTFHTDLVTAYTGYVDAQGNACGFGTNLNTISEVIFTGMHWNNKVHGLMRYDWTTNTATDFYTEQVEMKDGQTFGKRTDF